MGRSSSGFARYGMIIADLYDEELQKLYRAGWINVTTGIIEPGGRRLEHGRLGVYDHGESGLEHSRGTSIYPRSGSGRRSASGRRRCVVGGTPVWTWIILSTGRRNCARSIYGNGSRKRRMCCFSSVSVFENCRKLVEAPLAPGPGWGFHSQPARLSTVLRQDLFCRKEKRDWSVKEIKRGRAMRPASFDHVDHLFRISWSRRR